MQTKREELLAIGALLLATSAWGGTFVVVKHAIAQMPLMDLMAWRWIIAVAVLVAIRPRCLLVSRATYARGAAVGLTTFFGYLFQTIGLQTTSASVSGFITGMFVVFTPLLMWAFFRERLSASVWIAVALALGGLAALSLRGWSFGVGESWTLLGALFWAGQIITLARWSTRENAYSMATIQLGTAGSRYRDPHRTRAAKGDEGGVRRCHHRAVGSHSLEDPDCDVLRTDAGNTLRIARRRSCGQGRNACGVRVVC